MFYFSLRVAAERIVKPHLACRRGRNCSIWTCPARRSPGAKRRDVGFNYLLDETATTHLWVMEACAALRPIYGGHSPDTSDNADCGMSCTRCADDRTYCIHQHDRRVLLCDSVRWRSSPQAARRVNDEFCGMSRHADERHRRLQSAVVVTVPMKWKQQLRTCRIA